MSTPEDISPGALPFSTHMRKVLDEYRCTPVEPSHVAFECVDVAKRILLELRVREFTASDVIALAAIIEGRDRQMKVIGALKE